MIALLALACSGGAERTPARPAREVPVKVRYERDALRRDGLVLDHALAALPERPSAEGPDVVWIVLDTFRADRLGAYGSGRGLTPNLDAFAETATVFTHMRSTGAWTLPGHASMFTGLHPMEHGAHGSPADAEDKAWGLGPGPVTLAERLLERGYRTLGIAANLAFLDSAWGLSRGFELWLCERLLPGRVSTYVQGDRITGLARQALEARPAEQPLFLFLNYMDTHAPWVPREGYTAHPERIDPAHLPAGPFWRRRERGDWTSLRVEIMSGERQPTEAEAASWSEVYDAEVRWLDEQVGELLRALPSYGIDAQDYVIIVSDHGEFLGEHQLLEHSKDLYEEVLRVPLMIRGPGFGPGRDDRPIETHEVQALLLGAMGLEPLVPMTPGEDPLQVSELYWSRHRELKHPRLKARFDRVRRSYVLDSRKLIVSDDGEHEAYDLNTDLQEARSLYGEAEWVPALEAAAEAWRSSRVEAQGVGVELDDEQMKRLRSLGYVE